MITSPVTRMGDLFRSPSPHPQRELFLFADRRVTYGAFAAWVDRVCVRFAAAGVRRGDRVMVQLPNCLEALVLQAAAFRYGALPVPVVPIYREHEVSQIVADSAPSVIASVATMGSREPASEIDEVLRRTGHAPLLRLIVGDDRDGWQQVPDLPFGPEETAADLPEPAEAEEPALILYTSGTTSAPKGVVLTSRALITQLHNMSTNLDMDDTTVILAGTPLAHLGGFVAGLSLPAYLGSRSVVLPSWDADDAVRRITEEKVSVMMGATVFLHEVVDRYRRGIADGEHRLTTYMAAGAAMPPALIRAADEVGIFGMRCYGMTETAGICTGAKLEDPVERRADWDGRLLAGMEIQTVDQDRNQLAPGEVGDFRIRGPQLLSRYTDAAVTAEQIDAEGWFYPGDVGIVDHEGWVRMTGRSKDIVNRGGEKLSTLDIESAIGGHPDIARVAVTAVPDERLGETVGAWVTLAADARWNGPQPLLDHLESLRVAKQKWPVEWHVVAELPATASGKVQKHLLHDTPDLILDVAGPGRGHGTSQSGA